MAATFVLRAVSTVTGTQLTELPFTNGRFTRLRNSAGAWDVIIKLNPQIVAALDAINNTAPYNVEIVLERNGVPVYTGIVIDTEYNSAKQTLQISGREIWAYFDKRLIEWDVTYTTIDQGLILQDLLTRAKGSPQGDIRVDLPSTAALTTGTTRSISWLMVDCKPIAAAIEELALQNGGFEFSLDGYWSAGVLRHRLVFGFPKMGSRSGVALWSLPGAVESYRWRKQGGPQGNEVFGIGDDGTGHVALKRVKTFSASQPLLQVPASFRAVSQSGTLLSWTQKRGAQILNPIVAAYVTVHGGRNPQMGDYALGDDVQFQFNDPFFSNAVSTGYRLLGWTLRTPNQGVPEMVDLAVEAAV